MQQLKRFIWKKPVVDEDCELEGTLKDGFNSIKKKISNYYKELSELAKDFKANTPPSAAEINSSPIILCLGNHSSGKSSFINYILNENIQEASAAPLDDCFTLFTFGKPYNSNHKYVEQSGEGLVLNNRMPFQSLTTVKGGKFLQNRVKLKYVQEKKLEEIMLIDSPGMLDGVNQQRDYDFPGAVRWFSERADFILFFFDPEKPGTSGESLQIFSQLVKTFDHKMAIVMNKVDSFSSVNDFARTYGTLCWNLAKIISFKDMPMIYTSHLPNRKSLPNFDNSIGDLERKIFTAPARHVDTQITDFQKYTEKLLMHCRLISCIRNEVSSIWWKTLHGLTVFATIVLVLFFYLLDYNVACATSCGLLVLLVLSIYFIPSFVATKHEKKILQNLTSLFYVEYFDELADRKATYERIFASVKDEIIHSINQWGIFSFPRLSKHQNTKFNHILKVEVQTLLDRLQRTVSS